MQYWVTDEDPAELAKMKQEQQDFQPPLIVCQSMDPFDLNKYGKHWCFFKIQFLGSVA
jgi:hypothetical protein